jgi:hypothetical protein
MAMLESSNARALFPERNTMPDYRACWIDKNDRVVSRKDIVVPTDEAALEAARRHVDGEDGPTWERARKVGRLGKK